MSEISEYVYCWRVRYAYNRTDEQRDNLLEALAGVDGAVKECFAWEVVKIQPPPPLADPFFSIRAGMMYDALLQKAVNEKNHQAIKENKRPIKIFLPREVPLQQAVNVIKASSVNNVLIPPSKVLRNVIRLTYEGEKPEKNDIPRAFSEYGYKDDNFYKKHFEPLYLDSLQLRREDVRAYCRKNQIRQIYETDGLLFEDRAATDAPVNEESPPSASKKRSLSTSYKKAAIKKWYEHRSKLPRTNKTELRKWRDAHIAELLFYEDKTLAQIATVVFQDESMSVGAKKTRVCVAKKRIAKYAKNKELPIPPGCEEAT